MPLKGLVLLIILLSLVCILLKLLKTLLAKLIQLKRYAVCLSFVSWLLNVVLDHVFVELNILFKFQVLFAVFHAFQVLRYFHLFIFKLKS